MENSDQNAAIGCIICEATKNEVEFKITDEHRNGFLVAEGILQEGDEVNRNRRYYPMEELVRAISSPRVQELVESGNLKGEAGHPTDTSLATQAKVDPTLEQVWYLKLWTDGKFVKGRFRGTNNDLGRSFNEDLRCGQKPSFSLRAVGSLVNENGRLTVRKMQMITYDRVYFPSHSKAYTTRIVTTESTLTPITFPQYEIHPDHYYHIKSDEINKLSESGNIVDCTDDIVVPLTKAEMHNYIMAESGRVESVLNTFDILYESMNLNPEMNTVSLKTRQGDTVNVFLEEAIQKEILYNIRDMFR